MLMFIDKQQAVWLFIWYIYWCIHYIAIFFILKMYVQYIMSFTIISFYNVITHLQ